MKKRPGLKKRDYEQWLDSIKQDDINVWNEIFERFYPKITKTVNDTLREEKRPDLCGDPDVFQQIMAMVARRIKEGAFKEIQEPYAIPKWLENECRYRTKDWLGSQSTKKSVSIRHIETMTVSINQPIGGEDSSMTLEDKLPDPDDMESKLERDYYSEVEKDVQKEIEKLSPEERLLLKAQYMFYGWLEEKDIRAIAEKRKVSEEQVRAEIDSILNGLAKRNRKREEEEGLMVGKWYEVHRLEFQLGEEKKAGESAKVITLERRLNKKRAKLEGARQHKKRPITPSNKELAKLLGLSEEKARSLNVRIFRLRKRLKDALNNQEGRK